MNELPACGLTIDRLFDSNHQNSSFALNISKRGRDDFVQISLPLMCGTLNVSK